MTCSATEIKVANIFNHNMHPVKVTFAVLAILVITIASLTGCDAGPENKEEKDTVTDSAFRIPDDGKLTEQQVADYIVIRQQVIRDVKAQNQAKKNYLAEHRKEPGTDTGFVYFDQIEQSAAQAQGMNYEEFLWVKDAVITTQTTMLVHRYYELNTKIMSLLDKTLNRYDELNADHPDQREQLKMDGYVEEMKQEMATLRGKIPDLDNHSEALQHNIALVTKFKKELEALRDQESRISAP